MAGGSSAASRVAVVIVNYNGGTLLRRCLDALALQTYRSFRTIIVDNASTDGSLDSLSEHASRIEVIRSSTNVGFAAGTNLGIRAAADCEWIACLNPDAFPQPDWLHALMQATEQHPQYSFFGSRMISVNEPNRLDGTGDVYHVSGSVWHRDYRAPVANTRLDSDEIFSPCAAAALYRRSIILEVGGLDESFFCYMEDVDLGFRLRLVGYRCLYVPHAVVHHVGSGITGKRSHFTTYHGHRNLVWVFFKNMPSALLWRYLPQHLLFNLISLVWFSLRGQPRSICRAKWDALKGLPGALAARRRTQRIRRVRAEEIERVMTHGLFSPYFRKKPAVSLTDNEKPAF